MAKKEDKNDEITPAGPAGGRANQGNNTTTNGKKKKQKNPLPTQDLDDPPPNEQENTNDTPTSKKEEKEKTNLKTTLHDLLAQIGKLLKPIAQSKWNPINWPTMLATARYNNKRKAQKNASGAEGNTGTPTGTPTTGTPTSTDNLKRAADTLREEEEQGPHATQTQNGTDPKAQIPQTKMTPGLEKNAPSNQGSQGPDQTHGNGNDHAQDAKNRNSPTNKP